MKLGILGGGQLARMLALAAYPLGIRTVCFDPNPTACAGDVTKLISAEFNDESALRLFLSDVDCVTYETENIPLSCAKFVSQIKPIYPSIKALEVSQDRFLEKNFLNSLHIPTALYANINTKEELAQAVSDFGLPALLKSKQFGYDGKGQSLLQTTADVSTAWRSLKDQSLIYEAFVPFEYELSLIAVRNMQRDTLFYPLIHNQHEKGILRTSEAPFINATLQKESQRQALQIMDSLQYVGVLTIEFFYAKGKLIVNEIAPRIHNSGHWTIEGATTSQFENHLRALFDLPLGCTEARGHCFLLNCIGELIPIERCLSIPGTHYHSYGKKPQSGRKLGHVTMVETNLKRYYKNRQALLTL